MYVVIWRHNQKSPWTVLPEPVPSEAAAREKINQYGRYDMARRDYRIAPLGDPDTWHDPVAEQAALDATNAANANKEGGI